MNFSYGNHIPIFISVHDKVNQLKQVIKSYEENIKSPIKIVLFNHNTTYPPCLEYLKEMEKNGYKVYHHNDTNPKDRKYGELIRKSRNINMIKKINEYLQENPEVNYIVITDTDIELLNNTFDILEIYVKYYQENQDIEKIIGTSIKIDDVSKDYNQYDRMLRSELPHWEKSINIKINDKDIKCYQAPIDTTFKLIHREWFNKKRDTLYTENCLRTDLPYQSKHLDWYVNEKNITDDLRYYARNDRQSHYKVKL